VVLDQAGLDLLLAHPHVTSVEVMAIAATESRVDSPCSWQTLELTGPKDVRTVAYVPLHSLKRPLIVSTLLPPPDVPAEELPQLLQAATSRVAEHRQLFKEPQGLVVTDFIYGLERWDELDWAESEQASFSLEQCRALVEALAPITQLPQMHRLSFCFHHHEEQQAARVEFGKAELEALSEKWGSRLQHLQLSGVQLGEDFFPAIETAFPKLEYLELTDLLGNLRT
jgi:hypothetical protein